MQGMLEFGPLWLVALVVPAFLYGPHWAGVTSALGLGGILGGQAVFTRQWVVPLIAAAIVLCSVALAVSHLAWLVIAAQVTITLLVVAVSIPVTRRLHDAVPSAIRAGVASGVGTLTWRRGAGAGTYGHRRHARRPATGHRAPRRRRTVTA